MAVLATEIADATMQLPSEERIALVDLLLKSLNMPTREDIDALWAVEAEKRVAAVESGETTVLDGEQVFSEIRQRLQ